MGGKVSHKPACNTSTETLSFGLYKPCLCVDVYLENKPKISNSDICNKIGA